MIKNQPWRDRKHWEGIVSHVLSSGLPQDRLLLCHRGFHLCGINNPNGYRNMPDFEMAMIVRESTELPMILDPSHIGGSQKNVFRAVQDSLAYSFDGYMIEVHPCPSRAQTDSRQQLTIDQLKDVLELVRGKGG